MQDDGLAYPQKCIYLTYEGLLRVLFTTRNNKTRDFIGWACCKLFTLQMGTDENRKEIANSIYGIAADVARSVFNKSATSMSGLYWYSIGNTEDLRKDLDIGPEFEDGMLVSKFGESEDMGSRGIDHRDTYGKLPGAQVKLMFFAYIDPLNLKKAETNAREYFEATGMLHTCKGHNELFIIKKDKTTIEKIRKEFNKIATLYGGRATELNHKVENFQAQIELATLRHSENVAKITKEYDNKIADLRLEITELKKNNELLVKDIEMRDREIEIRDRDIEMHDKKIKALKKKLAKYKKAS